MNRVVPIAILFLACSVRRDTGTLPQAQRYEPSRIMLHWPVDPVSDISSPAMPTLTKEQEAEADEVDRIFEEAFKELEAHGSKRLPPDNGRSMQVYFQSRPPKSKRPPSDHAADSAEPGATGQADRPPKKED